MAITFEQANWMWPYMELRIAASTAFGKKFYKGMNNSAFGKTCESKKNRDQDVIVQNELHKLCDKERKNFTLNRSKSLVKDWLR